MPKLKESAIKNANLIYIVLDQDGSIIDISPYSLKITGYTKEEVVGKNWFDIFIDETNYTECVELFQNLFAKKSNHNTYQTPILCKDGSKRQIRWNSTVADNGTGSYVVSIGEDITTLTESLQQLTKNERRYKTLINNLPYNVFQKDSDSLYLSGNESFAKLLNTTPEKLPGTNDFDYFPEELATKYRDDDQRILAEGKRVELTEKYVDPKTGEDRVARTIKIPIYNDKTALPEGLLGIFWDITDEAKSLEKLEEIKDLLSTTEQIAHMGSWKLDILHNILIWSDEIYNIFEIDKKKFEPSYDFFLETIHPDDREAVNAAYTNSLKTQKPYSIEHRLKMKDGRVKHVIEQCRTSFDSSGHPLVSIGTVQDITARKEAEHQIASNSLLLRSVIDATPDLIFYKDYKENQGKYIGCNQAFEAFVGRSEDEIIGHDDIELFGKELGTFFRHKDKEMLAEGESKINDEWVTYPDGRRVLLQTLKTPFRDVHGEILGVLGVSRDITARWNAERHIREQRETLKHQAYHDTLTNLPNRLLMQDRLKQAIAKAKRTKEQVALLFIDLDQFKQINDSLGHETGDKVLIKTANRLRKIVREEDTIARLGGDEFVIIMESLHKPEHASVMAQHIITSLSEPIKVEIHELYITTSLGISLYPQDGSDVQTLLKNADAAMYRAKDEGRNTYQYYTQEMTELAFERVLMETSLRRAIKNGELIVYYQPQIDHIYKRIIGFESLIRWKHPELGLVSPAKFIPVAEETGLIIDIGEFVLEESIKQVMEWNKSGLLVDSISINISAKQLQQHNFFEHLIAIIEKHGCNPGYIWLEITEGYLMKNQEEAIEVLQKMKNYGLKLAIDDFGTGYSSLSYLKRLPIDKLKVDQSFVRDIPQDQDDMAITQTIIAMAKSLNLDVIAEGVETNEQIDFLMQHGCTEIQGYFYGKPSDTAETTEFIHSWNQSQTK